MAFGKRTAAVGPDTGAVDRPPQRKVLPDSVSDEETGALLREIGMSPDDEANLVPDDHPVNARLERDRAKHEAKLAAINQSVGERVPGGRMRAFSLLPDSCWSGETGHFLMMRLELFPYDDWNMIFLPADAETASALDLPLHPDGDVPAFVTAAERFMSNADAELRAAHAEAGRTHDFARFHDVLDEIRDRVRMLAAGFLRELDTAWEKPRPLRGRQALAVKHFAVY